MLDKPPKRGIAMGRPRLKDLYRCHPFLDDSPPCPFVHRHDRPLDPRAIMDLLGPKEAEERVFTSWRPGSRP